MPGQLSGVAVGYTAAGFVLLWSGIKGATLQATLTSLLKGQNPARVPEAPPVIGVGQAAAAAAASGARGGPGGQGGLPPPAPAAAGAYSNGQLRSLWIMAGGDPGTAAVAACIAQHESSGHASVTSSNPDGGTNVGLWQLDTPGGKGAGYSVAQLQNPLTNARVAIRGSSNGRDWSAWATAPMCGV